MSSNDSLIYKHLETILGSNVQSNFIGYIQAIKTEEDFKDYMENLVNQDRADHKIAYESIRSILFGRSKNKGQKNDTLRNSNQTKKNDNSNSIKPTHSTQSQQNGGAKRGKGKSFLNLATFEENQKKKQGRHECNCEAQIHDFMNNCLNCGRIHCVEEGPGPCFYCGENITRMDEELPFNSHKRQGKQQNIQSIRHRENKVFDDDKDYFKVNEKEPKNGDDNKRKMVIALDFATRRVIESTEEDEKIREKLNGDVKKHLDNVHKLYAKLQRQSEAQILTDNTNDLVDLLVQMRHKKIVGTENLGEENSHAHIVDYGNVIDEDVIVNTDHGYCLSMHQPYASLLVAGVKRHEGRTWKTNHRGRLWIAATAKQPEEDEVEALENFYRLYYNDTTLKFPREYPTGSLLGCVTVEDCLDDVTYKNRYPNGESNSQFVFICSNPIILPIFYPILDKLEKELHDCAKLSIRHAHYGID